MTLDVEVVRRRFPALGRTRNGRAVAYLDGPGGTQVPQEVIEAVSGFMARGGSNLGGSFATSRETADVVDGARRAMADLLNARPEEIAFGQNMSSMTFPMSRALARTWDPGDEIVVTRLDHDANISPWLLAAAEHDVSVRWVDFNPDNCQLDLDALDEALTDRTRLVAVTAASNAVGTVVDLKRVTAAAHRVGALVYVDGVHYTPHGLVDVMAWDVDFYACSAYKFFGPHVGILYGKAEHLAGLEAYKVRAAPAGPPDKWETGTQSFEGLAGVTAAVDYLASLGEGIARRDRIESTSRSVGAHEGTICERFLAGAAEIPGLKVYGIADGSAPRTATFAVAIEGHRPDSVAGQLGDQGIFAWAGHYYAVSVMQRLGVLDQGGLVRIGFVHYNTLEEVDRVLDSLDRISAGHT